MDFETIQKILQLGWPAIVMIAIWWLWTDYKRLQNNYIADLREIAGLRASLAPSSSGQQKNRLTGLSGGVTNGSNGG